MPGIRCIFSRLPTATACTKSKRMSNTYSAAAWQYDHVTDRMIDERGPDDHDPCPECGAEVKERSGHRAGCFICTSEDCDWTFDPVDLVDVD